MRTRTCPGCELPPTHFLPAQVSGVLTLLSLFAGAFCPGFPASVPVKAGDWELRLLERGPYVTWGGRPIVVGGYVRLYRPKYRGSLLHTFKARRPPCRVQAGDTGGSVTWEARHREYSMTYAVRLTPPDVLVSLDATVSPEAAFGGVEFAAFFLPPSLIAGGKGRALHGGKWTRFDIPEKPSHNWTVNGVPARVLELETRAGRWRFEDLEGERLRLSDMRLNPNYRRTAPFFWIFPAVSVPRDRHIRASVRMRFEPSPQFKPFSALPVLDFPRSGQVVRAEPPVVPPRIFPSPRRARFPGGVLTCPSPLRIGWSEDASAEEVRGTAERLVARLRRLGIPARMVGADSARVRLGIGPVRPGDSGGPPGKVSEAYELAADARGVCITGSDSRGLEYGAYTLVQLVQRRGGGVVVPYCRIVDWPRIARRAVHPPRLWPGSNLEYFRRYFDILAQARFNLVIWEISGSVRFPDQPWIWRKEGSFAPGEIRKIIAEVRHRHVEIVPELECLGHAREWLGGDPGDFDRYPWLRACFENERRTDLCPSNPRTLEVVLRAIDAISGLFDHPPLFHVGLDESWKFATCPRCRKRDPADLLADWLSSLHAHLRKRNQTMMMWHDMLLEKNRIPGAVANGDRTAGAIERIPKDIVICNWEYHPGPALPSSRYFLEKGFREVFVCPWFDPADVLDCVRAAEKLNCGVLSTNWNAFIRRDPMPSFASMAGRDLVGSLLAAEYAWSGTERRDVLLAGTLPVRDPAPDEIADSPTAYDVVDFRQCPPCPAFPVAPEAHRSRDFLVVDGIPFLPAPAGTVDAEPGTGEGGGQGGVGRGVRGVPVNAAVRDVFVLAGILERPMLPGAVFKVVFHFADGSQEEVPLDRSSVRMGPFFRRIGPAFRGRLGGFPGNRRYYVLRVRNPQPGRRTAAMDILQDAGDPVGLIVRGLTTTPPR